MPITLTNIDAPRGYSDQAEWREPKPREVILADDGSSFRTPDYPAVIQAEVVLRRLKPDWTPAVVEKADAAGDLHALDDGEVYYHTGTGCLTAENLRDLADELDRRNEND